MYSQSFSAPLLLKCLRKTDFSNDRQLYDKAFKTEIGSSAEKFAHDEFQTINPLSSFHLNGKTFYKIEKLHHSLVVRKIDRNLRKALGKRTFSRDFIISTISQLLKEDIPYRVYKLDIKSFFESIKHDFLEDRISKLNVNPLTKKNIFWLLKHYSDMVGVSTGVPRGLGISSTLSEIALSDFDDQVSNMNNVYYYMRYVDDILLITNGSEDKDFLEKKIELPQGLILNKKKESILDLPAPPQWSNTNDKELKGEFSYLGYVIKIWNIPKNRNHQTPVRDVTLDIAASKVKKIKTRIARSFITYAQEKNFQNLRDRLRLITSNYSMYDLNSGRKRFAGIYYSYPFISSPSASISELDKFIKNAIFSKTGRIFSRTYGLLKSSQKTNLFQFKFSTGHSQKKFVTFSPVKMQQLQRCWSQQ